MLEEQKKILDDNKFLNIRKNARIMDAYHKSKNKLFFLSVVTGFLIVCAIYFTLDISSIYSISVRSNNYLTKDEIVSLSGLNTSRKFLLTSASSVENKIRQNPFVKDVKVKKLDGSIIEINIEEKKVIGYCSGADHGFYLLDDDTRIDMTNENIHIIASVPLISGFNDEELTLMVKNFVDCDYAIINEISEIHKYPELKYQDVELIMRDGNYIFTSMYGLNILNHYYDIESSYLSSENSCYYFEDISGNAYTSACPWVPKVEEVNPEKPAENND